MDNVFIKQIEKCTEKEYLLYCFNSNNDDWKEDTSVFRERIINKEHIIIIIEDEEGNKFGGYVNEKIDKCGCYIKDLKSFLFSIESNGRMKMMLKFDIKEQQCEFYLNNQTDEYLFGIRCVYDICVYKENIKTLSYCYKYSFSYEYK